MQYNIVDGYTIEKFLYNLNYAARNGWIPVWTTFKEEFDKDVGEWHYWVIIEKSEDQDC